MVSLRAVQASSYVAGLSRGPPASPHAAIPQPFPLLPETDTSVITSLRQRAQLLREQVEETIAAAYGLSAQDMSLIVG